MIVGISFATVKTYLDNARYKLKCSTLSQATAYAVAAGMLKMTDLEERT